MHDKKKRIPLIIILVLMILVFAINITGFFITSSEWYKNLEKPPIYNIFDITNQYKIKQLVKNLGLKTDMPPINDVFCDGDSFYFQTNKGLLKTKNFVDFKDIKLPFGKNQLHAIHGGKENLVVISKKGGPYILQKDGQWHKFDKNSPKYLQELALGRDTICILDQKRPSIKKTTKKSGPDIVTLPKTIFRKITSNGEIFASTYTNISKATENGLPLLLSANGDSWSETECYIPVSSDESVGSYEIKSFEGDLYVRTRSKTTTPTLYFYKISTSPGGFVTEFLFNYEYSSSKTLRGNNAKIFNIFSTNSTKNSEPGIIIPFYSELKEFMLVRQIADNGIPLKYCNGRLFYMGKYGAILSSENTLDWNWSGLYKRNNTRSFLNPKNIQGLGIIETGGYYWFNTSQIKAKSSGLFYPRPLIYATVDGKKWTSITLSYDDVVDFNSGFIEAYVRGREIYLINTVNQKWWSVSINNNGTTSSTIKASYFDINSVYEEIGYTPPTED